MASVFTIIINIFLFIADRRFLKQQNAFVPHWGWIFFFPVYVYQRQTNNNLSTLFFWIFIALNFVIIPMYNSSLHFN